MPMKKGQPIPKAAKLTIGNEPQDLDWSRKTQGKQITYLQALLEIQKNPGKVVCVDKLSARGAIPMQAKLRRWITPITQALAQPYPLLTKPTCVRSVPSMVSLESGVSLATQTAA